MADHDSTLIENLRKTNRCRPEIQKIAEAFSGMSERRIESLLRQLIDAGEDKTLGILLNVCAVNMIKLDPNLLAESLKVIHNIIDIGFPYQVQDKKAIKPLLAVAQAEDISWERQAYAARLAAELAVRHDTDHQSVRKVLWKLQNEIRATEAVWMIEQALEILALEDKNATPYRWLTQLNLLDEIPEEKPPVVIGGDYSVRRPVSKLSRNAPCHCGSGKKYKKCCYEKDQELLHDASPYEGITRTQVHSSPALVQDAHFIYDMRAYELKKLRPSELNDAQLLAAYQRADIFGLRELAFEMLLELKNRPENEEFATGHMVDLLESTLDANDVELARKVKQHIPDDELYHTDAIKFHFNLIETPERFSELEERCKKGLSDDDEFELNYPLLELSCNFENIFPALSIIFARAAIASHPDRVLDNDLLLDVIHNARIALDLDPWTDPIEEYFDWNMQKSESEFEQLDKNKEIEQLKTQAVEAQKLAAQTVRELKEKELELDGLIKKLDRAEKVRHEAVQIPGVVAENQKEVQETLEHLRRQVNNLKVEIKTQQQARTQLRKQLYDEQKKVLSQEEHQVQSEPALEEGSSVAFEEAPKKILIPEYTETFRRSCESLSPVIVAKALRAAAGFAAHDKSVWRQTQRIETLADNYRIRIGLHYRLMIRWHPGLLLQILDLIPRASLETWIKQRQA